MDFPRTSLLRWFNRVARDLPWRRTYRPYDVAVSEYMLQQTQVVTMLPYYDRWMKSFPNWKSLSQAKEQEVLDHWKGLGYYQRARRLKTLADAVLERGGELPSDAEALLEYPGIGPYTSAAIASIAFNQPTLPIDGNIRRVMSRFLCHGEEGLDEAIHLALDESLKQTQKRREYVQALMELGASHCGPKKVDCELCPLKKDCSAHQNQVVDRFPIKKKRAATLELHIGYCWVKGPRQSLLLRQRPKKGRFAEYWETPFVEASTHSKAEGGLQDILKGQSLKKVESFRRDFTRYKVMWHEYSLSNTKLKGLDGYQWVRFNEIEDYPLIPVLSKRLEMLS